ASAAPGGSYVELSGTSMSAQHVAGAAARLRQRHRSCTPQTVWSARALTGDPVHNGSTVEINPLREGGGRIDLVKADQPLVFSSPTSLTFGLRKPGARATRNLTLSDAGGGAGVWNVGLGDGAASVS